MKMNFSQTTTRVKQAAFYIPFTVYFAVFAVAVFFGLRLAAGNNADAGTAFSDIVSLLLKVAVWFGATIIILAFFSVLVAWLYLLWHRKKTGIRVQITTEARQNEKNQKQTVKLVISPVLKPLFGFIKLRLMYDKDRFSNKFSLLENSRKRFFSTTIEGAYHWQLPEIKEYHIEKAVLYFEDILQFFSFAVSLPANSHFFTPPAEKSINNIKTLPRKTEDTSTRIEEMRRVEGEYLNYKNFEDNDDVRRIVWKIYARNKELVVRTPEIMDPYASHIYLYASFFNRFSTEGNSSVEVPFLNYFKVVCYAVYQNLVKQGFEVRYIPDQEVAAVNATDEEHRVKYAISTSRWQQTKDLKTYVKPKDASVVIVSSLSDAAEVKELMENAGRDIRFVFIKLSNSFKNQNLFDWMQWLFVHNEKNDIDVYKRAWAISPLRFNLKQNERQLEEIVNSNQPANSIS